MIQGLLRAAPARVKSVIEDIPVLSSVLAGASSVLDRAAKVISPGPALDELTAGYARVGRIDSAAPVTGRAEVEVAAPVEVVWAVLSDIAGWSGWSKDIHHVSPPATLAVGQTFVWWNGVSRISSELAVTTPDLELSWTGVSPGAKGVHRQTLVALGERRTILMSEESLNGLGIAHLYPSSKLQAGLEAWVAEIKAEAERRAG